MTTRTNDDPLLSVRGLNVRYRTPAGPVVAVRDLSLDLGRREALGIIGESGCGKSTLSYAILDYLAPNARREGSILFKGVDLLGLGKREMRAYRGDRIAMVYQNPYSALNPSLTIGVQLDEVTRVHRGLSRREARSESIAALGDLSLGDPEGIVRRYPHQVSGGIQQRICIAMALLCRPDLMILDEPTTALDVTTEAVILDLIAAVRERYDMSLIYISHDIGVVNKVSDRVAVMYRGEIVEAAPRRDIFAAPKHPYTRSLINCMPRSGLRKEETELNTIPGYVTRRSADERGCPFAQRCPVRTDDCQEGYGMSELSAGHYAACGRAYAEGRSDLLAPKRRPPKAAAEGSAQGPTEKSGVAAAPEREARVPGAEEARDRGGAPEPALDVRELRKYYRQAGRTIRALDGVNVSVYPNDVLGIVGESGCGKSTLGHAVSGLLRPSSGSIVYRGADISEPWSERPRETLKDIQLIFQNPGRSLNPAFTVERILARPLRKLLGMRSAGERRKLMVELLKRVDLGEEYLKRRSPRLSGGEKQRVALARAFSTGPRLVVCDEPTSALDVSVQASVLNLLAELQRDSGASYLFISHDLNVVNYISDHILVMYLGRACEYGTRDEVTQPPYHPYTEALLSSAPEVDPALGKEPIRLEGSPPDPTEKIRGCPFAGRCHRKIGTICETETPPLRRYSDTHVIRCHLEGDALAGR